MQSDYGQHGDQGVAQSMFVNHSILRQALGAGGADVVLAQLFEHGCAHHAGEDGGQSAPHSDGRQHQVGQRSRTGNRQQAEVDREKQNQDRPQSEIGKRQTQQADEAEPAVVPAIAAPCGANAGGNGNQQGHDHGGHGQLQGPGIALGDDASHRLVKAQRVP